MTVDLGYIVNSGVTDLHELHDEVLHDSFVIQVEVTLSDSPLTPDAATVPIYCSIRFGSIIVVGRVKNMSIQ